MTEKSESEKQDADEERQGNDPAAFGPTEFVERLLAAIHWLDDPRRKNELGGEFRRRYPCLAAPNFASELI